MTDGRETAASIFDRTAKLALGASSSVPDPASAALKIAAGIASAIAGLLRALGIADTKKAIDELASRRDEGAITDAHVARDNESIVDAVSSLYDDDDAADDKPAKRKRSSKK